MPPLVYSAEGERLAKQLYEETLDVFEFAGARGVVDQVSKWNEEAS